MRPHDLPAFEAMLLGAYRLLPHPGVATPDAELVAAWFRLLEPFSIEEIGAAFTAHGRDSKRGKFAPVPADLVHQLEQRAGADGRPSADEAWLTAIRASDEAATVVWTAETAFAFGECRALLAAGDEIGARFGFRAAYDRLVADARVQRRPAVWSPTLGTDRVQAQRVVAEAEARGLLDANDLERRGALPAPERSAVLLLESVESNPDAPAVALEALVALRARLSAAADARVLSPDLEAKADTVARAERTQADVEAYVERRGLIPLPRVKGARRADGRPL